jgi:hypothetical protein
MIVTELSVLSLAYYGLSSGNGFSWRVLARVCEVDTYVFLPDATRVWAGSSLKERIEGIFFSAYLCAWLNRLQYTSCGLYSTKYPSHLISITPNCVTFSWITHISRILKSTTV